MAQSYSNQGGSGARCGQIIVTTADAAPNGLIQGPEWHLVDGDNSTNNQCFFNSRTVDSTKWIKFDFGYARVIDEAKYYQQNSTSHGSWKWQGSNDNSSWTDIGSSFTLGGTATQTQTQLNGNSAAYRYYRLLGVSGSTSTNPWVYEFEFQIDSPTAHDISYENAGGEGNRSASITVTTTQSLGGGSIGTLVNGNLVETTLFFTNGVAVSGNTIKFDFGSGKILQEAAFFFSDSNQFHGNWKWQGSNDNSTWTDIGSSFQFGAPPGGGYTNRMTSLSGNTTLYQYYRLLGVSGSANSTPWLYEMAFKIGTSITGNTARNQIILF